MSNKYHWFTHDHDAHEDQALRMAIRKHGHVAGWVYWVTLELMHKHGSNGVLKMPLMDMAASMMVDKRTCKRVYQTLCELLLMDRATYVLGPCTMCTVYIKKFHERQSKIKSKVPSTLPQNDSNIPLQYSTVQKNTIHTYNGSVCPGIEDIKKYCLARKNSVDPQEFMDYCGARGWKIGNTPIADWKAYMRTWERRNKKDSSESEKLNPHLYD